MSSNRKLIAVVLSTVMLLSVVGPGLAAADEQDPMLNIEVEQNDDVVITVTYDGDAAEGATVDVDVLDEDTEYEVDEDLTTNEDGEVVLDAPEDTVNVSISATYEDETTETEVELGPADDGDEVDSDGPFGQKVMDFVHDLINSDSNNKSIGQQVAEFVTENNPGNAPDHAGPSGDQGPPEHAGSSDNDDRQGPPAHAGAPGSDASVDDSDEEEEYDGDEDEEENDDGDDEDEDDTEK